MNGGTSSLGLRDVANLPAETKAPDGDPPLFLSEFTAVEGGHHIIASHDFAADVEPPSRWRTIGPAVLAALSLIWVGTLIALAWGDMPTMSAIAIAQFGAALVTVPVLAGIVWLLTLRTSA